MLKLIKIALRAYAFFLTATGYIFMALGVLHILSGQTFLNPLLSYLLGFVSMFCLAAAAILLYLSQD